ncbi:hypothetical protein NT01EI_1127 [Edwardsiella ictaluri 93-146]|uniref:Uncharacterized protein n=1 Tax=Edwardsiella ictaluri (strain 93-146) TaxID=634503 RepID=C5BD20_EDWI9|nr:hypothetical protein NT01EI_1127 [Edwardsiella ictaluri 93-146]
MLRFAWLYVNCAVPIFDIFNKAISILIVFLTCAEHFLDCL